MLQCASVWRMNAYVNRRSIAEFCNHALVMWGNSYNWVNRILWARRPKLIVCTNMFQLKLENVSSTQLSNLSYAFTTSETENFPFFGETFLHTSFACLNIWNIYTHKFPIYLAFGNGRESIERCAGTPLFQYSQMGAAQQHHRKILSNYVHNLI